MIQNIVQRFTWKAALPLQQDIDNTAIVNKKKSTKTMCA